MNNTILFDLGRIVATPGALAALEREGEDPTTYLARHASGDWGDIPEEDRQANQSALEDGSRILSAYTLPGGTRLWIITDAEIDAQHHRQATTFLLPEEY
jgi:hypothetical protein